MISLAACLVVALVCVVVGAALVSAPAAWMVAGVGVGCVGWLVLADDGSSA